MALDRIEEMVSDLASRPGAEHGHGSKLFYSVGREYGLTCNDVYRNCLTPEARISRGRYRAMVPQTLTRSTAQKKTKVKQQQSQDQTFDKAARLELIARIARRFAREDSYIKSLEHKA